MFDSFIPHKNIGFFQGYFTTPLSQKVAGAMLQDLQATSRPHLTWSSAAWLPPVHQEVFFFLKNKCIKLIININGGQ